MRFVTPSDEEIASFEELPVRQQQPLSQADRVAQQVNVMLDEQSVDPELAQAVIHETLQEHAPVDDPVADTEAFHETEVQDEVVGEGSSAGTNEGADKGKKKVINEDEGFKLIDEESSDSNDSDDDDDNEEPEKRPKLVRIGLRVVSTEDKLEKSKKRKVREVEDTDYVPEEEEVEEIPLARKLKRAKSKVIEPVITSKDAQMGEAQRMTEPVIPVTPTVIPSVSTPTAPSTLIATPFQFQLNDLSNKMKVMEGMIRGLTAEMENQKKKHEAELEKQRVEHLRDINLMKIRLDRLSVDLERERVKNVRSFETVTSDRARETTSFVSKSELEAILEGLLKKKEVISDEGCKEDEVLEKKDDDEEDGAAKDDEVRPLTEEMSKALIVFEGESTQETSQRSDKGKAPVVEEISSDDDVQEVLFVEPLKVILTAEIVDKVYKMTAEVMKKKRQLVVVEEEVEESGAGVRIEEVEEEEDAEAQRTTETEDEPGLINTSSSEHESIVREVQLKFGHDKLLAENVYADLMEKKFQEETAVELKNKEVSLVDSLSSSESDYVPDKG